MINYLKVHEFAAVPYLETSAIMQTHPLIEFSTIKPNVIVGPNGSGKSALLKALSLFTLTHFMPQTGLDCKYLQKDWMWTQKESWCESRQQYLKGLDIEHDKGLAFFFRPHHIPGNEQGITHAMMVGYFKEAKDYARLTEKKSSGQQHRALQDRMTEILRGAELELNLDKWQYGLKPKDLSKEVGWIGPYEYRAEKLKTLYGDWGSGRNLVLMDEPEQALDLEAELALWATIEEAKTQVIIASHSLYPILNPERFSIIETVDGYADKIRSLVQRK